MKPSPAVAPYIDTLKRSEPFSEMSDDELGRLLSNASVSYHSPGETLLVPGQTATECWIVLQGKVRGERSADASIAALELHGGEMFPVGAVLTGRSVVSRFFTEEEVFSLRVPAADFIKATQHSAVLADFCDRRMSFLLERSRRALQHSYIVHQSAEQQLPQPLSALQRRPPLIVSSDTPIRSALAKMQDAAVGSVVVVDESGRPLGIVTDRDIVPRVVLASADTEAPIMSIATSPVVTLREDDASTDAALLMAERGFRHVVVVDTSGVVRGVISERDLFAMQRQTLTGVSGEVRRAKTVDQLAVCGTNARQLARNLIAQGVDALSMTRFISRLNDQIARRLLDLVAQTRGFSPQDGCWIALGSEGRHEQTISTDQDNALILAPACDKAMALAVAREVNEGLAACGFPLCKGNIMASNPELALTVEQWRERFWDWLERGDPQSLLQANIFFDLRPLWGDADLASTLQREVLAKASANKRFLKQLADNALEVEPPLSWLGNLSATDQVDGVAVVDLKRYGVRPFVDAARVLALANACSETNTVERLRALGSAGKLTSREVGEWRDAFSFVQALRMRAQERNPSASAPNTVAIASLSPMDARILKECFRQARKLQQRVAADYP